MNTKRKIKKAEHRSEHTGLNYTTTTNYNTNLHLLSYGVNFVKS